MGRQRRSRATTTAARSRCADGTARGRVVPIPALDPPVGGSEPSPVAGGDRETHIAHLLQTLNVLLTDRQRDAMMSSHGPASGAAARGNDGRAPENTGTSVDGGSDGCRVVDRDGRADGIPDLLVVHLYAIFAPEHRDADEQALDQFIDELEKAGVRVIEYAPEERPVGWASTRPRVYVSIAPGDNSWSRFPGLADLPADECRRWVAYHRPREVTVAAVFRCWLVYTEPAPLPPPDIDVDVRMTDAVRSVVRHLTTGEGVPPGDRRHDHPSDNDEEAYDDEKEEEEEERDDGRDGTGDEKDDDSRIREAVTRVEATSARLLSVDDIAGIPRITVATVRERAQEGARESRDVALAQALATTAPPPSLDVWPGFTCATPLVSVFVTLFRSGDKVQRVIDSVRRQTYPRVEVVMVDDSDDDGATYADVRRRIAGDPRFRLYGQARRSGYIGAVKRCAAGMCAGEVLVEMDHDDAIEPDCLARIVAGMRARPECGFASCESGEWCPDTNFRKWYGWDFGFGYGVTWRQWALDRGDWINVTRQPELNWRTVRHLVGLPNHVRAWRRDVYHLAGGHRPELLVADDYDLLVRTFLRTRFLRLPHYGYCQYINAATSGGNQTEHRRAQIQTLVAHLGAHYESAIDARLRALGAPALPPTCHRRPWSLPDDHVRRRARLDVTDHDRALSTHLFVFVHGRGVRRLLAVLDALCESAHRDGWKVPPPPPPPEAPTGGDGGDGAAAAGRANRQGASDAEEPVVQLPAAGCEYIVVGSLPAQVERAVCYWASRAPPGRIRWWIMEPDMDVSSCIAYGRVLRAGGGRLLVHAPGHREPRLIEPEARALSVERSIEGIVSLVVRGTALADAAKSQSLPAPPEGPHAMDPIPVADIAKGLATARLQLVHAGPLGDSTATPDADRCDTAQREDDPVLGEARSQRDDDNGPAERSKGCTVWQVLSTLTPGVPVFEVNAMGSDDDEDDDREV